MLSFLLLFPHFCCSKFSSNIISLPSEATSLAFLKSKSVGEKFYSNFCTNWIIYNNLPSSSWTLSSVIVFSGLKFPFLSFLYLLFLCWFFSVFHLITLCLLFMEHGRTIAAKVLIYSLQNLYHLGISICWLSFPLWDIMIFLFFMWWIILDLSWKFNIILSDSASIHVTWHMTFLWRMVILCFTRQLTTLGPRHKSYQTSVVGAFTVSCFKVFAVYSELSCMCQALDLCHPVSNLKSEWFSIL